MNEFSLFILIFYVNEDGRHVCGGAIDVAWDGTGQRGGSSHGHWQE